MIRCSRVSRRRRHAKILPHDASTRQNSFSTSNAHFLLLCAYHDTMTASMEALAADLGALDLSDDAYAVVASILQYARNNEEDAFLVFTDLAAQNEVELQFDLPAGTRFESAAAFERIAEEAYNCRLVRDVFAEWQQKAKGVRRLERKADRHYERSLTRRALFHLYHSAEESRATKAQLEERLAAFATWRQRRLCERVLRRWIEKHRAASLWRFRNSQLKKAGLDVWREKVAATKRNEQRAEDARDYFVASSVLNKWRLGAKRQKGARKFGRFYLSLKYLRVWKNNVASRKRGRRIEILTARYHQHKNVKDLHVLQGTLRSWRGKLVTLKENEEKADQYHEQQQEQKARSTAHNAVKTWFIHTADSQERALVAEEFYGRNLIRRFQILSPQGVWRTETRRIKEMEVKAGNFYDIKSQEMALRVFRKMRHQTARSQQMGEQADKFYDRKSEGYARKAFNEWNTKTGEHRGDEVAPTAPPTTPAARKQALFTQE